MARKLSCDSVDYIDPILFRQKISEGGSQRSIAAAFGVSQATVRHYLKKNGLRTLRKPSAQLIGDHSGNCLLCGKEMSHADRRRRRCSPCDVRVRRYVRKLRAVQYLGGKCRACGFDGSPSAMDFHHAGKKKFVIANNLNRPWDILRAELDQCVLLCRNCHSLEHSKYDDEKLAIEAKHLISRFVI